MQQYLPHNLENKILSLLLSESTYPLEHPLWPNSLGVHSFHCSTSLLIRPSPVDTSQQHMNTLSISQSLKSFYISFWLQFHSSASLQRETQKNCHTHTHSLHFLSPHSLPDLPSLLSRQRWPLSSQIQQAFHRPARKL